MSTFPVYEFEFEDDTVAVVEVTRSGPVLSTVRGYPLNPVAIAAQLRDVADAIELGRPMVRINVDADQADDFLRTLDHRADG